MEADVIEQVDKPPEPKQSKDALILLSHMIIQSRKKN
jgi:hypothetical protein